MRLQRSRRVANPSDEQIEDLHAKYVAALKDLFDRNKHLKGPEWAKKTLLLEDEELDGEGKCMRVDRGKID